MRVASDEPALQTQGSHGQEDNVNEHSVLLASSAISTVLWSESVESLEHQSGSDSVQ